VFKAPGNVETNDSAKLALKLTNPVASPISIPFENWFDPAPVSKLVKLGDQRMSIGATPRCVITSPQYQAKGCGLEFTVTPLFPAKR